MPSPRAVFDRWVAAWRRVGGRIRWFVRPPAAAQLAAIVDHAADAIVSKSLDGIITSWNRGAETMFGYSAAESVGRPITLIIPPDRLDEEADIIARLRRGEAIGHFETVRLRKDGRRIPVSLAVSPIRDARGRVIGASKIARDISAEQRARDALRGAMRQLEALYRLADEVGRAKDLVAVCEAAVDAIVAVGADRASVLLYDDDGVMRFQAWRGLSPAYRAAVEGHSPWTRDAVDPRPVVVEDALRDPALAPLRDLIAAEGVRALAFVPLLDHGHLLGKFMIYHDTVHAFPDAELRLAASIAQHVSFGVARVRATASIEKLLEREQTARRDAEGARLEAEQRRAIAEELARLARSMAETLDVRTVGERIVAAALHLFEARAAGLRLVDHDGSLVGVAFAGGMRDAFPVGHAIPPGPASMSGLAILERSAVWTDDSFTDARLCLAEDLRHGMRAAGDAAVLAAPLRHRAGVIGALSIADRLGRRFTPADAETVQAFADQAALALANARLYEEARRRQREAEVVAELAQRINASLDLQTTLERLVDGARELCDADIARIVVRDPETGRMRLRHQVGTRWSGYNDRMIVEPGHGSGGHVLVTGKPFRTEDYRSDARISRHYAEASSADSTMAQMVVPVPGESGVAGLLYVDRRTRRPFSDADEALLIRLAGHAGTAIRNGQLFAAEQAARAEADAANRGKDQFLAVLSHELRTPLNAITGWARLLRGGHLNDAQRAHGLAVIERNAVLQGQLVADLLDMSRIAAGKMDIERAPVDLALVVRETLDAVASDIEAKKLRLLTTLDDGAGEVLGEARRLHQVVANLLLNAVKFTPEGGTIELSLARHEVSARLTVRDTGQGIEAEHLSRIFNPFEQEDSSTTRSHQGLGLGLAIVRQIVGLHGGTIRAESAGRGRGATFTVDLPVLAVRLARGRQSADTTRAGRQRTDLAGLRVLIVDDQPDARDLFALVLREHGAEIQTAASASEAVERLGTSDIDALISDISMPEIDGYELVRRVRNVGEATGRRIHAIAVTAHTGHDVKHHAIAAGFDAHATKPLDPEQLVLLLAGLRDR